MRCGEHTSFFRSVTFDLFHSVGQVYRNAGLCLLDLIFSNKHPAVLSLTLSSSWVNNAWRFRFSPLSLGLILSGLPFRKWLENGWGLFSSHLDPFSDMFEDRCMCLHICVCVQMCVEDTQINRVSLKVKEKGDIKSQYLAATPSGSFSKPI